MIPHFVQHHAAGVVAAATTISGGSAATSFFVATLPILQWIAAMVAIASGFFAIAVAVRKLRG